jgi:hypothetical protein
MNRLLLFFHRFSLARLFSLTRYVEEQLAQPCAICDERAQQIADLKATVTRQENYILSLLGKPPINPPESRATATYSEGRQTLRGLRRQKIAVAIGSFHQEVNDNGMAARADEFAGKVRDAESN